MPPLAFTETTVSAVGKLCCCCLMKQLSILLCKLRHWYQSDYF